MRYLTAGESHGKGLTAILDGFPAGVAIDPEALGRELGRRQLGYGRGGRMKIENDAMEILSGLMGGVTLGSPISFFIRNRDFDKWREFTDPINGKPNIKKLTAVRPGHADYVGSVKYGFSDARPVLERASARETAARVGVGAFCKQLLAKAGVIIGSHVTEICGERSDVQPLSADGLNLLADKNPVRCIDSAAAARMIARIDECIKEGDTAGGTVQVIVSGFPAGVGSYTQYDKKLDGILAGHLMSVQAVKSVEFGMGREVASLKGSAVHDRIFPAAHGVMRKSNNAGGIEGGMSNGENIVISVAVKPIPTLMQGLKTVDISTGAATVASPERSDYCAVPAAGVVAENVAAYVLADELLKVTGGDDFAAFTEGVKRLRGRFGK